MCDSDAALCILASLARVGGVGLESRKTGADGAGPYVPIIYFVNIGASHSPKLTNAKCK